MTRWEYGTNGIDRMEKYSLVVSTPSRPPIPLRKQKPQQGRPNPREAAGPVPGSRGPPATATTSGVGNARGKSRKEAKDAKQRGTGSVSKSILGSRRGEAHRAIGHTADDDDNVYCVASHEIILIPEIMAMVGRSYHIFSRTDPGTMAASSKG